ncbi:uncharacterized protein SPSK_06965 [Sporothrix schenckii 1099-18]|uniref:CCZ1/INTU/HSP4 first Longin domain-containing protein n=2 Tax=Sporothrix schenckii TaxID=29908 RepID=U7Q1B5_SPOS1|nr:uncharacterized protein SPSK_06965 [Sporothrix schenckii 1099-18]ERT01653.1 hypothetical protein HMPREF1624_02905 [Sporothrix schenckii ATCC 58251]KJR88880.1 hypothetical protein SPSK_06965 [Sporothrix schenckii 1099-18]
MSSADKTTATAGLGGAGPAGASGSGTAGGVVPAQLGFLAIYNPSLGTTDETIEDQIVYYGSATVSASTQTSAATDAPAATARRRRSSASAAKPTGHLAPAERNERLRQIGLAQGMVAFGRSFAGDQAVDTIETDKTRVVLHELEPGWWLLASVDLTRLPGAGDDKEEYSAREVKPAVLLLQDLLRAHAVFLLHHDVSLDALFRRVTPRSRFTVLLARYWDIFLSSWSVLLHGNPVRDVFPGMRLAACGELGIGVGEEERGSGEREVLEGLVESTDGLVDLVVCRYGDAPKGSEDANERDVGAIIDDHDDKETGNDEDSVWLGTGSGLGSEDGAIFLGVGALTRPSLRSLTYWMEDVYSWGPDAYGIADNPSAPSRQARHRQKGAPTMGSISEQHQQQAKEKKEVPTQQEQPQPVMMPPPSLFPPAPVTQITARGAKSPTPTQTQPIPAPQTGKDAPSKGTPSSKTLSEGGNSGSMDKYMSIMKLGYGTYWSLGGSSGDAASDTPPASSLTAAKEDGGRKRTRFHNTSRAGRFLIPLVDEVKDPDVKKSASIDDSVSSVAESDEAAKPKESTRTTPKPPPRIIVVDMAAANNDTSRPALSSQEALQERQDEGSESKGKAADTPHTSQAGNKLRVVVYAQRPFLYTFLFDQGHAESAATTDPPRMSEKVMQTLIDRQLSVLHKPLLRSTAYRPNKSGMTGATAMLNAAVASSPSSSSSASASGAIYDLIWDPGMLTIHSTLPNIPDPHVMLKLMAAENAAGKNGKHGKRTKKAKHQQQQLGLSGTPPWSRVEALNTHMQILNLYAATRSNGAELERMCKTSRGWWIVWNRLVDRSAMGTKNGAPTQSKYGSTLFEEAEEAEDGEDDDDSYQRAPSDCDSDDTATGRAAAAAASAAMGTYTVRKEIILIRKASDHADNIGGGSGSGGAAREGLGGGGGGGGSGLGLGFGLGMSNRASSAMRAFSASTYLGFGGTGSGGSGTGGGAAGGRSSSTAGADHGKVDAAAAEEAAAAADRGAGWADGASKLAHGIGVDTKKYIEGLLTLNK